MSAEPDFVALFHQLERRLEAEADGVAAEIVRGVYYGLARPRPRHGRQEGRLYSALERRYGDPEGSAPPDWLFVVGPELRSQAQFSRISPDLAAWKRSAGGWPDLDTTPVELVPEWVAEVLSPSTARLDRGDKKSVYGSMGVGWLWLVDLEARSVETFTNVRGEMVAGPSYGEDDVISGPPFGEPGLPVKHLLV